MDGMYFKTHTIEAVDVYGNTITYSNPVIENGVAHWITPETTCQPSKSDFSATAYESLVDWLADEYVRSSVFTDHECIVADKEQRGIISKVVGVIDGHAFKPALAQKMIDEITKRTLKDD